MDQYVTHHFAHEDTLDRAERWLLLRGFRPAQLEIHREGNLRITVVCPEDRAVEANLVFQAAEVNDPDGVPGLWEQARMPVATPTPHAPGTPPDAQPSGPPPVTWHPQDVNVAQENAGPLSDVWDVNTRFK